MKRIIVIGCGTLGMTIIRGVKEKLNKAYEVVAVCDANEESAKSAAEYLGVPIVRTAEEIIGMKPDFVVEAASKYVVEAFAPVILKAGLHMIILSVGALANEELTEELRRLGDESGARLHIASGAVGGFDLMRALRFGGLEYAEIHSSKNPRSLNGAPYLNGRELPPHLKQEVFEGNAREAIEGFPKNVNVSVSTALATLGVDETRVRISSIPGTDRNTHQIYLAGEFGDVEIRVSVKPDKANPKSSTLAAWSVLAMLEKMAQTIVI